jgi:spermidine/putrescine transport system ATP-binding protein
VAQFVGSNNKLPVTLRKDEHGGFFAKYINDSEFILPGTYDLDDNKYDLFVRPESIVINPGSSVKNFNTLDAEVKSILFDGGNSRLLVTPRGTKQELVVALPQTKLFDHIKVADTIKIGWDAANTVCFKEAEWKIYDEE